MRFHIRVGPLRPGRTYANFNVDGHPFAGDITQVDEVCIPEHDVLVGGFPCQPFSLAGVSKKNALGRPHGFEDETQGTLFFDVARIIEKKRPKAFLLENVRNLISHDKGNTFPSSGIAWRMSSATSFTSESWMRVRSYRRPAVGSS